MAASVVKRITKHKKGETRESKERKFEKKVREINKVSCFNIYIVMFAFQSSTVEVGRL